MQALKRTLRGLAIFLIILNISTEVFAQEEVYDISLAKLLNMDVSVATKTEMTMEDAPSVVSVITSDEIRNMGARNIEDILKTLPGFDVIQGSNVPLKYVCVRGISSNITNGKVKFLINGHSIQGIWSGPLFNLNALPVENLRRIEIIRGPGSALYGTNAFIGVINFITKEGGDEPSKVSMALGSFDTMSSVAEFSYKEDGFKAYLYADYHTTDGDTPEIDSDLATVAFGGPGNSGAPGKMTYNTKHHTFQANISYKNLYLTSFYQQLDTNNPVGVTEALTDENEVKESLFFGELGCKSSITENGHLTLKTYYDHGKTDFNWELFSEETAAFFSSAYSEAEPYPQGEGIVGNPYFDNSVYGSEITLDYKVHPAIQLVGGGMYDYIRHFDIKHFANSNVTGAPLTIDGVTYAPFQYLGSFRDISEEGNWNREAKRKVGALYAQGTFDFKKLFSLEKNVKALALTSGLRYDDYSDVGASLNPRAGLIYAPDEKLYFKMLYGTAFRAPNFDEMYNINNPSNLGNPELEPEKISTIEAMVGYHFTEGIRGSLTYFDTTSEDLIQLRPRDNVQIHVNLGEIRARGVEFELKAMRDIDKYAYFNLTWQNVKDVTNEKISDTDERQADFDIGNIPEIIANIGFNYDVSKYLIANVSANYVGERKRSGARMWDGETLVQADKRAAVESHVLLNASLTFKNFMKGLEVRVSGYNLSDEDHRDPNPSGNIKNDIPREGVSFMTKVSYSF